MKTTNTNQKLTQKLPEGTFATCSYLIVSKAWCVKYGDAKIVQPDWRYEYYCMSNGGCDK